MKRNDFFIVEKAKAKFLDKKKKQKEKVTSSQQQQYHLIKIQKNIRRYLTLMKNIPENITDEKDLFILTEKTIKNNPIILKEYFERAHKSVYIEKKMCKTAIQYILSSDDVIHEQPMRKFLTDHVNMLFSAHSSLFAELNKHQKWNFIQKFLVNQSGVMEKALDQNGMNFLLSELRSNVQNLILWLSRGDSVSLLVLFQTNFIPEKINLEEAIISTRDLSNAYSTILEALSKGARLQINNEFAFKIINYIIEKLVFDCEFDIIRKYKVDPIILKVEPQATREAIMEKEEWISFIDFLGVHEPFYCNLVKAWIACQNEALQQQFTSFAIRFFSLLPIETQLNLTHQQIENLFNKAMNEVRVHQIEVDLDQQKKMLLFLMIIDRVFMHCDDLQFINIFQATKKKLEKIIKDFFMKIMGKIIFLKKSTNYSYLITKVSIRVLQNLYNKIFRTKLLDTVAFVNQNLTQRFLKCYKAASDNDQVSLFLSNFPYIFPLKVRLLKFRQLLREYDYYYVPHEKVKIRRGHQFQDAFSQLHKKNIKSRFSVIFIDDTGVQQTGIDAGGLMKEFINRVLRCIFKPQFEMFVENSEKQLMPDPNKAQISEGIVTQHYQFIGKMMGRAILEGITLGPKFSGPFLNCLIGKKNSFEDLWKIDYELYKSLMYIKNMKEDAQILELTFEFKDYKRKRIIKLKPNGDKIRVNDLNKIEYINLLANYQVNKLFTSQCQYIRKGMMQAINQEHLLMFNYEELNYLISGQGTINIHDLKNFTRYHGCQPNHPTIINFWKVLFQLSQEEKSNLLMFVTSCPRPSFLGFADMSPPFTIAINKNLLPTALPVSHTCSNVIELPAYQNEKILKERLLLAINSKSGFWIA